jgi:hypothetical protein
MTLNCFYKSLICFILLSPIIIVFAQDTQGSIILDKIGQPFLIFEQVMDVNEGENKEQKIEPLTLYKGRCKYYTYNYTITSTQGSRQDFENMGKNFQKTKKSMKNIGGRYVFLLRLRQTPLATILWGIRARSPG